LGGGYFFRASRYIYCITVRYSQHWLHKEYGIFATTLELMSRTDLDWSLPVNTSNGPALTLQHFRNASVWDVLENEECIEAYAQRIVSARGDLLAMSSDFNTTELLLEMANTYGNASYSSISAQAYNWICYDYQDDRPVKYSLIWCDPNIMIERHQATSWAITDKSNIYPVDRCLSQPVEKRCIFSVFSLGSF